MGRKRKLPTFIPITTTPYERMASRVALREIRISVLDEEILELQRFLLEKKIERLRRDIKIAALQHQVETLQGSPKCS
ncbi:hypothetical protein QR680_018169 [Steinernema hermaphroditum]|uniref:Uncharacterized protein n=1 Tax=Steinernema hermaphroditum TaxID=289476 RepID=A0AA39LQD6_9BILA|nr:hypothetical protein QR680_018169 [Steinernema hermaphroditum]